MDQNGPEPENKPQTDQLVKPRKTTLGRFLAMLRITIFLAVIITAVISILPAESLPTFNLNLIFHPFSIVIAVIVTLTLGVIFYLIFAPAFHPEAAYLRGSFDFESMLGIVLGSLGLVFAGIITLFTTTPSNAMIFGLILMGAYTFYVYKVIKDTWGIQKENAEIRKKYGELVEVDKEKSDFIMITSHQLRTPLTEMRWSLEQLISHEDIEEKYLSVLKKTKESVGRLANIVEEMLKTRAFEIQNHILRKTNFSAAALISEIVTSRDLLAQQKNVDLNFSPPEKEVTLNADKDKMKIVLENIIDNAVRYAPNGRVDITLGTEGRKAKIEVQDTGIGIDLEDQKRIFTKFFRAKNALLVQPDGSGIGLFATKTIVEQHGGTINFFSQLGKGTKFVITLPLTK